MTIQKKLKVFPLGRESKPIQLRLKNSIIKQIKNVIYQDGTYSGINVSHYIRDLILEDLRERGVQFAEQ